MEHLAYRVAVLVVGHALLIVVEALTVFIQAARLILLEFFTRFLRAEGCVFKPRYVPASPS